MIEEEAEDDDEEEEEAFTVKRGTAAAVIQHTAQREEKEQKPAGTTGRVTAASRVEIEEERKAASLTSVARSSALAMDISDASTTAQSQRPASTAGSRSTHSRFLFCFLLTSTRYRHTCNNCASSLVHLLHHGIVRCFSRPARASLCSRLRQSVPTRETAAHSAGCAASAHSDCRLSEHIAYRT